MLVRIACSYCQTNYHLADRHAGKKVQCRTCGRVFIAPSPEEVLAQSEPPLDRLEEVDAWEDPDTSRRDRDRDRDCDREPDRRPSRRDEEDLPPRRRGRREGGGIPLWVWLVCGIGGFMLLLAIPLTIVLLRNGGSLRRITPENLARIQMGMTQAEVEAILGKPNESTDLFNGFNAAIAQEMNGVPGGGGVPSITFSAWKEGNYHIVVAYENGRVFTATDGNSNDGGFAGNSGWPRPGTGARPTSFPNEDRFKKSSSRPSTIRPTTGRRR
jgi:hypothetical protein